MKKIFTTKRITKDALLQLCVNDSLFEASVEYYSHHMRNYGDYANMTEEEVRKSMIWTLKNDPELISGLDGEDMPTIRNTERIKQAMTVGLIRNDQEWVRSLLLYATQQSISLDDALKEEADRMDRGESLIRDEVVFDTATFIQMKKLEIMEQWRHNNDMILMIQQKAREKGITFEEMLEKDARWFINQKIEKGELFQ